MYVSKSRIFSSIVLVRSSPCFALTITLANKPYRLISRKLLKLEPVRSGKTSSIVAWSSLALEPVIVKVKLVGQIKYYILATLNINNCTVVLLWISNEDTFCIILWSFPNLNVDMLQDPSKSRWPLLTGDIWGKIDYINYMFNTTNTFNLIHSPCWRYIQSVLNIESSLLCTS